MGRLRRVIGSQWLQRHYQLNAWIANDILAAYVEWDLITVSDIKIINSQSYVPRWRDW